MAEFVYRDGQRLTAWMNYKLGLLAVDLMAIFGVALIVSSGIRTYQEQVDIFLSRYVTARNVNGRRVYDTRVWNGTRYYRISAAGTVAVPGTSNHEIQGSKAAVDLRDSGRDAGIATVGSVRSNWLRANAWRYGLIASGFSFHEAWHYDMPDVFRTPPAPTPTPTPPAPPAPKPEPTPEEPTLEELMSLKSVVIGAQSPGKPADTLDGTILDFEGGFTTSWGQVKADYNTTIGRVFTEGGSVIVTRGHYDLLRKDFSAYIADRKAHELAVAKASAGK